MPVWTVPLKCCFDFKTNNIKSSEMLPEFTSRPFSLIPDWTGPFRVPRSDSSRLFQEFQHWLEEHRCRWKDLLRPAELCYSVTPLFVTHKRWIRLGPLQVSISNPSGRVSDCVALPRLPLTHFVLAWHTMTDSFKDWRRKFPHKVPTIDDSAQQRSPTAVTLGQRLCNLITIDSSVLKCYQG